LFGIAYAVGLLFVLRDPPRESGVVTSNAEQPRLGQALSSLFSSSSFWLLLAFWGLLALAGWAVMGWMPTFFKEQFKLDQGAAGISATSFLAVAMFAGKLVGGAWADRWSRVSDRARILVPAIGLFIAAPATLMLANTSVLALAITGLCIYGFTRVFSDANLMPILCQVADSRYRATGYGVLNMFSCLVGGITVYLGGVLRDAHISVGTLFQAAAAGMLVCGVLMISVKPQSK